MSLLRRLGLTTLDLSASSSDSSTPSTNEPTIAFAEPTPNHTPTATTADAVEDDNDNDNDDDNETTVSTTTTATQTEEVATPPAVSTDDNNIDKLVSDELQLLFQHHQQRERAAVEEEDAVDHDTDAASEDTTTTVNVKSKLKRKPKRIASSSKKKKKKKQGEKRKADPEPESEQEAEESEKKMRMKKRPRPAVPRLLQAMSIEDIKSSMRTAIEYMYHGNPDASVNFNESKSSDAYLSACYNHCLRGMIGDAAIDRICNNAWKAQEKFRVSQLARHQFRFIAQVLAIDAIRSSYEDAFNEKHRSVSQDNYEHAINNLRVNLC